MQVHFRGYLFGSSPSPIVIQSARLKPRAVAAIRQKLYRETVTTLVGSTFHVLSRNGPQDKSGLAARLTIGALPNDWARVGL
jgi:hypothetical protein